MSENTQIRRNANGFIDYSFYDRRAHSERGVAFRAGGASVKAHVRYLLDRLSQWVAGEARRLP